MRILQASVLVSALLVLLVPDHCLAQDQVRFADPAPMAPTEERSELQTMLDDGIVASELTQDDILAITCNALGDVFDSCSSAVPFEEYLIEHSERLFGISAPPSSTKLSPSNPSSASSSGGHKSSYRSNNYRSSQRPSGYRSSQRPSGYRISQRPSGYRISQRPSGYRSSKRPSGYRSSELVCPSPIDQSAIYQLSEDLPDDFNVNEYVDEFFLNPNVTVCLAREILNPQEPPQVIVEDFLQQAKATCPSTEKRLFSYTSVRFTGQCFVLPFGEAIFFKECSANRFCQGCQEYHSSRSTSQKLCIPEYRTANFWAYCPSQSPGRRFVRDKIIIPLACNCLDVPCERALQ